MKMQERSTRRGFTLVELLVVIAIIGILMALLLPALTGAMLKGKAADMGSKVRDMFVQISSFSNENEVNGLPAVYPTSDQVVQQDVTDVYPDFTTACGNSTDYFKFSMVEKIIDGVDTSFFSGPGLVAKKETVNSTNPQMADLANFGPDNNAWCVSMLIPDAGSSDPAIFTRNIKFTANDFSQLDENAPLDTTGVISKKLFSAKYAVCILKGYGVKIYPLKQLYNPNGVDALGQGLFFGQADPNITYEFISPDGDGPATR